MTAIRTPDGPIATTQGATVWVQRYADFARFVWGGECLTIGDISDERGGLSVTTRADARAGGLRRDGVLLDPPGTVSTSLSMKRVRGDKLKSELRRCFWLFDKRTQCQDFDDPQAWTEIERVYRAKVGSRTTTPGTSIGDTAAEDMVNFDVTALDDIDLYRLHLEDAVPIAAIFNVLSVDVCHGERCAVCGDGETDAVIVAGTEGELLSTPHILVNVANGDPEAWTDIGVTEWGVNDVNGIVCLGQWGGAVSNGEAEVLYSRDRFTTRVAYTTAALTAHPPNAIAAASQSLIVVAGDDGYIYLSRDGLVTCPAVLEGGVTASNLTGVRIAPSNRQIIYVWSNAADVILKTENAGESWFQIATTGSGGTGIFSLEVHPDNANLVLAGTDAGELYESTDGGETWTEQAELLDLTVKANAHIVDLKAAGGGVWFAGVVEAAVMTRVYVNYEDGASGAWEYFNPLDGEDYGTSEDLAAIAAVDPNRCIAVGGDGAAAAMAALLS